MWKTTAEAVQHARAAGIEAFKFGFSVETGDIYPSLERGPDVLLDEEELLAASMEDFAKRSEMQKAFKQIAEIFIRQDGSEWLVFLGCVGAKHSPHRNALSALDPPSYYALRSKRFTFTMSHGNRVLCNCGGMVGPQTLVVFTV